MGKGRVRELQPGGHRGSKEVGRAPYSPLMSAGQSIGVSASASVLPMNIQDWSPLGWTGLISLRFEKTLKRVLQHHSSKASILWLSAFFIVQFSYPYITTGKIIALTWWTFVGKVMWHECMHAKSFQPCPILCYPIDCSPPGPSAHGVFQAKILE